MRNALSFIRVGKIPEGYRKNTPTDTPPCANNGVCIMENGYSVLKLPLREKARTYRRFKHIAGLVDSK